MKKILISTFLCVHAASATPIVVTPVSDATVYSVGAIQTGNFLALGTTTQGILKFSWFDATPYSAVSLILNPYALPALSDIGIYGFNSSSSIITGSEYDAGTYLGTLVLPSNLGYGQLLYFDVTSFVQSSTGSYIAFNLRGRGDALSSLDVNYGTPPELIASVPDNPSVISLFVGIGFICVLQFKLRVFGKHGIA